MKIKVMTFTETGALKSSQVIEKPFSTKYQPCSLLRDIIYSAIWQGQGVLIAPHISDLSCYNTHIHELAVSGLLDSLINPRKKGGDNTMGFFADLRKGLAILAIVTLEIPKILLDGKVTVQEMADVTVKVCDAMGWKTAIEVPPEIQQSELTVINRE